MIGTTYKEEEGKLRRKEVYLLRIMLLSIGRVLIMNVLSVFGNHNDDIDSDDDLNKAMDALPRMS